MGSCVSWRGRPAPHTLDKQAPTERNRSQSPSAFHLLQLLALGLAYVADHEDDREDRRHRIDAIGPGQADAGTAREAMEFYQSVLGGKLEVMTYGDMGETGPVPPPDGVMHAASGG